jgi:hypothetical protein
MKLSEWTCNRYPGIVARGPETGFEEIESLRTVNKTSPFLEADFWPG